MTQKQQSQLERATEIAAEKGHKVFLATQRATGETVYLVRSSRDSNQFYALHISAGRIHCHCQCAQRGRICSHAAAVRIFLSSEREALASIEQKQPETEDRWGDYQATQALCMDCHKEPRLFDSARCAGCQKIADDRWDAYQNARLNGDFQPVATRHMADRYGDTEDYCPPDYRSHEYR